MFSEGERVITPNGYEGVITGVYGDIIYVMVEYHNGKRQETYSANLLRHA